MSRFYWPRLKVKKDWRLIKIIMHLSEQDCRAQGNAHHSGTRMWRIFNRLIVKPPSFQDNWSITEQLHRGLKRGVGSIHYRKWLASRSYLEEATNTRYTARSFIHYNAVNTLKKFARCRNRDEISRLRLLDAVASLPPRVHHVNWSGKNYRRHRHSWRAAPRRHFGCIRSKSSDCAFVDWLDNAANTMLKAFGDTLAVSGKKRKEKE